MIQGRSRFMTVLCVRRRRHSREVRGHSYIYICISISIVSFLPYNDTLGDIMVAHDVSAHNNPYFTQQVFVVQRAGRNHVQFRGAAVSPVSHPSSIPQLPLFSDSAFHFPTRREKREKINKHPLHLLLLLHNYYSISFYLLILSSVIDVANQPNRD